MRKVRFKLLTQIQIETLETDARTFGELQDDVNNDERLSEMISFGTKKVQDGGVTYDETLKFIERSSRTEYGKIKEALLPVGDCLFFVTPTRTKSGMDVPTEEDVNDMSYKELRTLGSKLNSENEAGIILTGTRDDILDSFEIYIEFARKTTNEEVVEPDFKALLLQAVELIQKAIEKGREIQALEPIELAIEGVTFEELEIEAEAIRTQLS